MSDPKKPNIQVLEVLLLERPVRFRLPFRFGVVTLTEAPQAFARVRVRLDNGREAWGCAAELMVPKWFDKNESLTNEQNFDQLRLSLRNAAARYQVPQKYTAFGLFESAYADLIETGQDQGLNPLLASFGPALLDRAILDAVCRSLDMPFTDALKRNVPGVKTDVLARDVAEFEIDPFLKSLEAADRIEARHTVGMVDPLTEVDLAGGEYPQDGLPVTLEDVIDRYGHSYFKIKIRGELDADIDRLRSIASVLDKKRSRYFVTLDGNEQFTGAEGVLELLDEISNQPELDRFRQAMLFVEQPLNRAVALERSIAPLATRIPVIIDESDGKLDAFPSAKTLGYTGVSSKQCKGLYKSVLNTARCAAWNAVNGRAKYFMSGEDLTCQAGIAVQQDLVLVATLGITHVERNGHHYVRGMHGAPQNEQRSFASAHQGMYTVTEDNTCLRISDGRINLASLNCPGFAVNAEPNWATMQEIKQPEYGVNKAHG